MQHAADESKQTLESKWDYEPHNNKNTYINMDKKWR